MGKDVIFDYSKAAAFIHEEEIAGIKAGVQAARETHQKSGGEDSEGFRCPAGNRYRRFVSGRKSGDRVPVP